MQGRTSLLTCDAWEHAYYIDNRNRRAPYIEAFWKLVNRDFAALTAGRKSKRVTGVAEPRLPRLPGAILSPMHFHRDTDGQKKFGYGVASPGGTRGLWSCLLPDSAPTDQLE